MSCYPVLPMVPSLTALNALLSRFRISCSAFLTVPETRRTVITHSLPEISRMKVNAAHTIL